MALKTLTSYYEVLGVGPTAEAETLRKAYRRLARKHHPDVSTDPRAHENMARINEAFETLIDPNRRNEYDAMLAGDVVEESQDDRIRRQKPVVVRLIQRLQGHKTPVYATAFAPDTAQLVSSGFDNEIIWWNEAGFPVRRMKVEQGVISTLRAFSLDRLAAAGSAENQVSFCRLDEDKLESWKAASEEWVGALAVSPDGQSVATGSLHNTFSVIDTTTGECRYRSAHHDGSVMAVAWSADGKVLASGGADARINLYHGETGERIGTISQIRSAVTAIAFSPDGQYLAAAGVDLSIRVFTLSDGNLVKMMFGHTKVVESLAFHSNGWLFASGSRDGTVGLWNAAKGIGNVRIEASNRPISTVSFSLDGTRLAAGGQDKLVRLWEVVAKDEA
jgi:WD40 repeat protein